MSYYLKFTKLMMLVGHLKGGPGASGRVLPHVTGRPWFESRSPRIAQGEGKACH